MYLGSVVGCFVIHNLTNGESFSHLFSVMTTTEIISLITSVLIVGVPFPLLPLHLGYSVSKTNFTWKKNIHWPKNGWGIFVGLVFFTISAGCVVVADYQLYETAEYLKMFNTFSKLFHFLPFFYLCLSSFLIASWVTFINDEVSAVKASECPKLHQVKNCVSQYECFGEGFSSTFLLIFAVSQILGTFSIFRAVSQLLDWKETLIFFQNTFLAFGLMINTFTLASILDDVHKNLLSLCKVLDRIYTETEDRKEEKFVRILKDEILQTGPMTAMGFFDIDRSTITAMGSFTATYIVILLQFRIGEK